MNNKVGVLTVAYKAERFMAANIRQFRSFGLPHYVVCSDRPWRGEGNNDMTMDIVEEEGANLVYINSGVDHQQRNHGLAHMKMQGIEWALVVDTDEFWEEKELYFLLKSLKDDVDVVRAPNMHVYWKTMGLRIQPDPQPDNPVVAIRTNQQFKFSRLTDARNGWTTGAEFHHFSFVRSDEEMRQKISGSEHNHEWIPEWYEKIWTGWTLGDPNLHPVVPSQFADVVFDPAPNEILELFYEPS